MNSTAKTEVGTFSGQPMSIGVEPLPGCIAKLLDCSNVDISNELRQQLLDAAKMARPARTTMRKQHLRLTKSFGELSYEIALCELDFQLANWFWYLAALVNNQLNGGDGDLDLFNTNALRVGGMVVSAEFTEARRWSLTDLSDNHVFREGTMIILPSAPPLEEAGEISVAF